ncbi:MAG: sensor histidine kinase [Povalibacter sp.]
MTLASSTYPVIALLILVLLLGVALFLQMRKQQHEKASYEKYYADITHAARLALIGELTGSVTHEVTQPLSAILSNVETAELLIVRPEPNLEMIREILADIRRDDLRAHAIVQRLRPMLRKSVVHFENVDLNVLISNVLSLIASDAQTHSISVHTALAPRLPSIPADPVHLQQVVLNLLINAMHAVKDTPGSHKQLEVRTEQRDGDFVQVSVLDNGTGISEENRTKLFESFFTTKNGGMGLGLSIAKSIVRAHGGSIWAENRDTGGAAFKFTVPVKTH